MWGLKWTPREGNVAQVRTGASATGAREKRKQKPDHLFRCCHKIGKEAKLSEGVLGDPPQSSPKASFGNLREQE